MVNLSGTSKMQTRSEQFMAHKSKQMTLKAFAFAHNNRTCAALKKSGVMRTSCVVEKEPPSDPSSPLPTSRNARTIKHRKVNSSIRGANRMFRNINRGSSVFTFANNVVWQSCWHDYKSQPINATNFIGGRRNQQRRQCSSTKKERRTCSSTADRARYTISAP